LRSGLLLHAHTHTHTSSSPAQRGMRLLDNPAFEALSSALSTSAVRLARQSGSCGDDDVGA
jgi:hypothetical protein